MPLQAPDLRLTDDLRTLEDRAGTLVSDLTAEPAESEASAPPEVWLG